MALTTNQKEIIVRRLETINAACPICAYRAWTISDEIVSAMSVSLGGSTTLGGPFIPMAQIVCRNCGFVSHHAIGVLGIDIQS